MPRATGAAAATAVVALTTTHRSAARARELARCPERSLPQPCQLDASSSALPAVQGLVYLVGEVVEHAREGEDAAQDGTALGEEVPHALAALRDLHFEGGEVVVHPEARHYGVLVVVP